MIFVCLGNPGKKYQKTRHSFGRRFGIFIVDNEQARLPARQGAVSSRKKKEEEIIELENGWKMVFLDCFMNESGTFIKKVLKSLNHQPSTINHLVIIHDDLDIPFGEFKIQFGKSAAGHKGVQSIIDALKTKDFWRIRLGISNPEIEKTVSPENFVLMPFTKEEEGRMDEIFEKVVAKILIFDF
jgi:PTH1 family peptidyl-tRNA hydrolase